MFCQDLLMVEVNQYAILDFSCKSYCNQWLSFSLATPLPVIDVLLCLISEHVVYIRSFISHATFNTSDFFQMRFDVSSFYLKSFNAILPECCEHALMVILSRFLMSLLMRCYLIGTIFITLVA